MNNSVPPTFCILPWIHVSTKTNGEMRLCCTTCASSSSKTNTKDSGGKLGVNRKDDGQPANLNSSSLLEGWNNSYMRSVRKQMLSGEVPAACTKCFTEESHGLQSKRMWETDYWSRRLDVDELIRETESDGRIPEKIRYFDLRLGHKCNLRCTMCSPHDSSGWIDDWNEIFPKMQSPNLKQLMMWDERLGADGANYHWYKNPQFWVEFDSQIPHLRQIYFAGGEPMLIKEHFELLERIIARGAAAQIELRYNSNGTVLPERIFSLWSHFKRVRFGFSLDCFGIKNKYIRYPADWNAIERNLRRLDETGPNVEVTLACAVQALNVFYLPEFIQWKIAQNFKKINPHPFGAGLVNFHLVYHPAFLNLRVLPPEVKKRITEKFDKFYDWLREKYQGDQQFLENPYGIKRLKHLIDFMNGEDWSNRWPEFQEYIGLIDSQRALSLKDALPEFWELLHSVNPSLVRFAPPAKQKEKDHLLWSPMKKMLSHVWSSEKRTERGIER